MCGVQIVSSSCGLFRELRDHRQGALMPPSGGHMRTSRGMRDQGRRKQRRKTGWLPVQNGCLDFGCTVKCEADKKKVELPSKLPL